MSARKSCPQTENPLSQNKILVVDDEQSMCQFLAIMLRRENYLVTAVTQGSEALEKMREEEFDVVITDIKMPEMDGLEVLSAVKKIDPNIPVIIMTAFASQRSAIEAVNRGAFQYLEKNAKNDDIKMVVKNALEMRKVRTENVYLKRQLRKSHEEREIIADQRIRDADIWRASVRPRLLAKWKASGEKLEESRSE